MNIAEIEAGALQYRAATIEDIDTSSHEMFVKAAPYDEPTDIGGNIIEEFKRGAFAKAASAPHRLTLFADHGGPLIGRGKEFEDRQDGPYIRYKLGRHDSAQQALMMVEDGIYDQISVEFRAMPDFLTVQRQGDMLRVTHKRAHLSGAALVPEAAYSGDGQTLILSARDAQRDRQVEAARAWFESWKKG